MSKTTNKFSPKVRAREVQILLDHDDGRFALCFAQAKAMKRQGSR
jgi:hypothetical protein